MKNTLWIVTLLLAGSVACAEQPEQTEPAEPVEDSIAALDLPTEAVEAAPVTGVLPTGLIAMGEVDPALVERTKKWAMDNLALPLEVLPALPRFAAETFDEVAAAAAPLVGTQRAGLVVLWRPVGDLANHGAFFPDSGVAVANLNPMFTPDTDAELIERRVERQVVRGICLVFGLEASPNPQSAMFAYQNLEQLDVIGRNLDPPWLKRLQEAARARGVALLPDHPFNLLR
jgi:hypothetical protein